MLITGLEREVLLFWKEVQFDKLALINLMVIFRVLLLLFSLLLEKEAIL